MLSLEVGNTTLEIEASSPAIIYGHADADGHLAAEQTRANLLSKGVKVHDVIISRETRNYRFWENTFSHLDFREFRLVVAVDIAFRFENPSKSLESLLLAVDRHPNTYFVVIDHHALAYPEKCRKNLTLAEVDTAYSCCLGTPSDELMVVAAICDGDGRDVKPQMTPEHVKRALGVRRAAADVNGIVGSKLLSFLRQRRWEFFESLAEEPPEYHRNVRGHRVANGPGSPLLEAAQKGVL